MIWVLSSLGAGLAGGWLALAARGDGDGPLAQAAATATAAADPLQAAIARVLPAIVTVVADLPTQPVAGGGTLERENIGSGIVMSARGHVVTNFHVIDGASTITVVLSTGERRAARLLDDDSPFHDVAVLQVQPAGLRAAAFGDSDRLQLGERVAALSSGLVTFENQAKTGVVSATHVAFPRPGFTMEDMVQTDAAVNHGDSGGALINVNGEVIGLLTTVVRNTPDGQTVEGVALAHSSNSLRSIVDAVTTTGANPRPRYGIERVGSEHVPVTAELATAQHLPVQRGALVVAVETGSPAAQAGVKGGDIIVGINGTAVDDDHTLVTLLGQAPGDGRVDLMILRGQSRLIARVTPVARGPRSG